jgi:hypothetical protein
MHAKHIGGHIFHVIKAHDLTQNIFMAQFHFKEKKCGRHFFTIFCQWEKHVREKVQATKHQW